MSQLPYIEPYIISSNDILADFLKQPFDELITAQTYNELVYYTFRKSQTLLPDHVFSKRWQYIIQKQKSGLCIDALGNLSTQFLQVRVNKIEAKIEHFNEWQGILSRMSGLPVISYLLAKQKLSDDKLAEIIHTSIGHSVLVHPHQPDVADYIMREQLNETHIHLNGSTSAEQCWLRALHSPKLEVIEFSNSFNIHQQARELVRQIDPTLDPSELKKRLSLAIGLRDILSFYVRGKGFPESLKNCNTVDKVVESQRTQLTKLSIADEVIFQSKVIQVLLDEKADHPIQRVFWLYLLLMNQYCELMVQREDQFGFDFFQKFTFTDLRENEEQCFLKRFKVIHGNKKKSQVGFFEGRFAPKKTYVKLTTLLKDILSGYHEYLGLEKSKILSLSELLIDLDENEINNDKFKLALVIHFIKSKENQFDKSYFRFSELRLELRNRCDILIKCCDDYPLLTHWLRGIDGAANELHTPPEVFSPIFRVCKQAGFHHATFHVGEDFVHLLSGIRAIDDAVRFLPLQTGDRLGHCTAIGIWPDIWAQHMPHHLRVTREDWLLDLLFIWKYFSTSSKYQKVSEKARQDAIEQSNYIFNDDIFLDIEQSYAVLSLRDVWPEYFLQAIKLIDDFPGKFVNKNKFQWRMLGLISPKWQEEAKHVENIIHKTHEKVLKLYARWLTNKDLRTRSNEIISVERDYLPNEASVELQDMLLQKLSTKKIIIESLPTSNVRISQYKEMKEHHIFRWMGLDMRHENSGIKALVSLGSDDPGIFANDLVTDFYHLYQVLREQYKLSDHDAIKELATVNERGRIYRFHHQPTV